MVNTHRQRTARGLRAVVILALVVGLSSTLVLSRPDAAAADTLEDTAQQVAAAIQGAGGDSSALVNALPSSVTDGHEYEYQALVSGGEATVAAIAADVAPDQVAVLDGIASPELVPVVDAYAPGADALAVERDAVEAIEQQGSVSWPFFKGEFLNPSLSPPYGQFTPQCENNWCMPDLYISDYDSNNYCGYVPDLWFKWPCYQHDLGYTFVPRTSSSSSPTIRVLSSFVAVNTQWYSQMRHECDEQISGVGPTWIFCQVVAFTMFVFTTAGSFGTFLSRNHTTGYDELSGPASNPSKPPVYLRWHGCTGPSNAQVGYTPLHGSATVNQGSNIFLTGRTHRGTRALFEFRNSSGTTVANHMTGKSRDNCIIHHEPEAFSTWNLPVGTYQVVAWYYAREGDGVNRYDVATGQWVAYGQPTFEPNVLTLTVTAPPPPDPPDPPDPCPYFICP